jgi:hypothetical protein
VFVDGGLLQAGLVYGVGDLGQLVLGDHQVAHHHGAVAVFGEGRVPAEGKSRLDGDSVADHAQVGAGQRHPVDRSAHQHTGAAQHGGDRCPVRLRGRQRRQSPLAVVGVPDRLGHRGVRRRSGDFGIAWPGAAGQYQQASGAGGQGDPAHAC